MLAPLHPDAPSRLLSALGVLLLAAGAAACAGRTEAADDTGPQSGKAASSASPSTDADAWRRYGDCLKEAGLVLEDREDGQIRLDKHRNSEEKQRVGAKNCRALLPNEKSPPSMNAEQLRKAQEFSACMRREGIAGYPDPDPGTGEADVVGNLGSSVKENPAFNAALQSCGGRDSSTNSVIGG